MRDMSSQTIRTYKQSVNSYRTFLKTNGIPFENICFNHFENVVFIPYQDKKNLIYSLNAGDVHWCVNAKGIKGVSCPSKAYGIMAVGKPILGVLESGTEIRSLIETSRCGKCCEPGNYAGIAELIQWYIDNVGTSEVREMGQNGRKYLEENLKKDISIEKYINEIKRL